MSRNVVVEEVSEEMDLYSQTVADSCPCYHCTSISMCGVRQPNSPVECKEMREWTHASNE